MRRALVMLPVLCLLVAACSSSGNGGAAVTTTSAGPELAVIPTPPTVPRTGTDTVYVVSVDLTARTITVDPMQFLTGQAATDLIHKTSPTAAGGTNENYAIVNDTKDQIVLIFPIRAVVRMVHTGGAVHREPIEVPHTELAAFAGLGSRPFAITIEDGIVTQVNELYVP